MKFHIIHRTILSVGLLTLCVAMPFAYRAQELRRPYESPLLSQIVGLNAQSSAKTTPEGKLSPGDLLQHLRRAEEIISRQELQSGLTAEQRFVLLLSNYHVLLLRGKIEDAHQSYVAAATLNKQVSDADAKARNDFELSLVAGLDPWAEKLPADLRAKFLPPNSSQSFPAGNDRVIRGSREWAIRELGNHLRLLRDPNETVQVGTAISTFTDLYDRVMVTYGQPANLTTDAYLRFVASANALLAYEQYILRVNENMLEFKREYDYETFETGFDAYSQAFAYFTPTSKRRLIENNLTWADAEIALDDAMGASVLVEFSRRLMSAPELSFEGREALQEKVAHDNLIIPYLLKLQASYSRLVSGQVQPAGVLLRGELEEIQKIPEGAARDEVLGLFYRSRARVALVTGDLKSAEDDYTRSIGLLAKLNHPGAIGAWGELAQARAAEANYKQAVADLGSGFELRDKLRDKYSGVALSHQSATLYVVAVIVPYLAGDFDKMKVALDEAIPIFENLKGAAINNPETLAMLYAHRGLLEVAKGGNCAGALENFDKALNQNMDRPQTPLTELVNLEMGKCFDRLGRQPEALESLKMALIINRNLRKSARGSAAYSLLLRRSPFDEIQSELHKVIFEMMEKRGFTSDLLAQEFFFYAELSKSRGIVDEMESMRRGIVFVNPNTSSETQTEMNAVLGDFLSLPTIDDGDSVKSSQVFAEQEEFMCQMSHRHGRDAVMLEYIPIVQRDRVILFIVSSNSVTMIVLKTPWSQIVKSVEVFRQLIKESLSQYAELRKSPRRDPEVISRIKQLEKGIDEKSVALAGMLFPTDAPSIGSVGKYIAGKSLILVPHGELHNLPFVALRMGGEGVDGQRLYLIDVVGRMTTVPSATVLRSVVSLYKSNLEQRVNSVLLVGDPESADLPAVEGEFKGIEAAVGNTTTASERKGLVQAVRSSPAVHFAVHAFFNRSALGRSGLSLKDGTWTLGEITMLEAKRTRVVTMGACESGESGILPGDEVWGLAHGFMFAGIPAVVGSLWDQDDEASRIFFTSFYGDMSKRADVGAAFRSAMLNVRRSSDVAAEITDDPELMGSSNPCFWAGFNFIGE